jgi:hypothetical protein
LRKSISILLIVSIIPALMAIQQASSQTVTSTTVSSGTSTIIAYTDTISPTKSGYLSYCWYTYETLNVTSAGSQYSGSFTTDKRITFFIMTGKQYHERDSGTFCGDSEPPPSLLEVDSVNSYSFDWTAPAEGEYYFVFDDRVVNEGFTISFRLWQQATITASNVYTLSPASSLYSTSITQEQPSPFLFAQNDAAIFGAIAVVAIALVGLALRSRHKPAKIPQLYPLRYCGMCGAKLPADAEFCGECGYSVRATS